MHARSAVFSIDEHKERFARARQALKSAKLDACLMVAPENVYMSAAMRPGSASAG